MKKKILSILIVLALVLALLPTFAAAAETEPEYYGLYINGFEVTSENKDDLTKLVPDFLPPGTTPETFDNGITVERGGWAKYDPETNTLYLKDATIVAPDPGFGPPPDIAEPDSAGGEATRNSSYYFYTYPAIEYYPYESDVIIRDEATRDLEPIAVYEPLTIVSEGTNVVETNKFMGGVAIQAPAIELDLESGSTLTVTGGDVGFSAAIATSFGNAVAMPLGRDVADEPGGNIGDYIDLVITGSGTLIANGGDACTYSAGLMANGIVIDGATVVATGGDIGQGGMSGVLRSADPEDYYYMLMRCSMGVFASNILVVANGANLTATGGAAYQASIGACSFCEMYIEDAVVDAKGSSVDLNEEYSDLYSCGVYAWDYLAINGAGSKVTAEGAVEAFYAGEEMEVVAPLRVVEPEGGYVGYIEYEAEYGFYTVIDPDAKPIIEEPRDVAVRGADDEYEELYDEYLVPATYAVISGEEVPHGYWVKIAETANGTVTSSLPGGGEGLEITLTATPDQGATLYEIKALDDAGRPVELIEAGEGVYTLVMPASDVRVRARFIKDLPFNDVDPDDYFYDAVVYLYENGITTGTSEDTYEPEKICTRAETVTFLWRTLGEPEPTTTECKFTDVSPDAYYYKAVLWAAENGVTLGTSETTISPDDNVLRCMTEAFLYRTIQLQGGGFTGAWAFQLQAPDAADVPDWAYESTCWMVMNQIVQGDEAGNILPLAECNRGQIAAMIYRTVA